MNGDVKRALFAVRDGVVDEMGNLATPAGAGPDWDAARDFYRQWREDFHEPTGPSGSGSPVAQALNAVDPSNIRKPFILKQTAIGNRGLDTLRKYAQFGGDKVADRASAIINRQQEFARLKPEKPKAIPAPPKEVRPPKPVEAELETLKPPTREDLVMAKRRALRETAISWGKLHTYDLGILAGSVLRAFTGNWSDLLLDPAFVSIRKSFGRAISRSEVRNWLIQPTPEEIELINRLPEMLKQDLKEDMLEFVRKERSAGRPLKLGLPVQAFLGVTRQQKKPGEQLQDLRAIQERHSSNPAMPIGPQE
jgi:hypothetical protein